VKMRETQPQYGKGGCRVQKFQNKTRAFVESAKKKDSDKRWIKIYGPTKARCLAMICDLLGRTAMEHFKDGLPCLEFVLSPEAMKHLQDQGDEYIMTKLKVDSGAKDILILQDNTIYVSADEFSAVSAAGALLNKLTAEYSQDTSNDYRARPRSPPTGKGKKFVPIFDMPRMGPTVPVQMLIEKAQKEAVTGPRVTALKEDTDATGATLDVRREDRNMNEITVTIKGTKEQKFKALNRILIRLDEALPIDNLYFVIPEHYN